MKIGYFSRLVLIVLLVFPMVLSQAVFAQDVAGSSACCDMSDFANRAYTTEEKENLELVLNVYNYVLKPLDSSRVDDFIAPDYIQHSPLAESGAQGLKDFLDFAGAKSPLAEHHLKRMFVDGDYVIAHVHVIINPGDSGNAVVDIFRIENGMVAEHWDAAQEVPVDSVNPNGMF